MPRCLIFPFLILTILMYYGSAFANTDYKVLSKAGAESVISHKAAHDKAVDSRGIGVFYGSESYYGTGLRKYKLKPGKALIFERLMLDNNFGEKFDDYQEMEKAAADKAKEENFELSLPPKSTDCFEWCLLIFKDAFEKSGMKEEWLRITRRAHQRSRNSSIPKIWGNGMIGAELAKVLVETGWLALYYNPDTNIPADKPAYIPPPPKDDFPGYGYKWWKDVYFHWEEHSASHIAAKYQRTYYGIPISDFIVDYRPTLELELAEEKETTNERGEKYFIKKTVPVDPPTPKRGDKIKKLEKVPFGFILAGGGRHTALISYGKVYEVHRDYSPTKKDLIEIKDFETEWQWLSGVIIVPPGAWSF